MSLNLVLPLLLAAAPEVTLDEALKLAMTGNAELKVLRADVDVATAQVGLAHDWNLPAFRVQFNDVQDVPTGQFRWYAGLSWQPPNPWQWSNATDAAQAKVRQQQLELAASSWALVKDLRLGWLDVSGAAAHERVAKDTVVVRKTLVSLLGRRLAQGHGTQFDLNLAQLGETDARQDELRWQSAGLKAAQVVSWLVGQPVKPVPMTLATEPPELPTLSSLEERLDKHPALEALRMKVESAAASEKTLAAKRLPWPEVQMRLRQSVQPTPTHDFQLGLTVPLAIVPAPELAVASAQTARNRQQLEVEKLQRHSELEILLARAQGLRERWLSFEQDYRATLESHRQLAARVLNEGSLDPTLLITADRQAIDLEHKRLEVQLDLARTLVELEGVAGPR